MTVAAYELYSKIFTLGVVQSCSNCRISKSHKPQLVKHLSAQWLTHHENFFLSPNL